MLYYFIGCRIGVCDMRFNPTCFNFNNPHWNSHVNLKKQMLVYLQTYIFIEFGTITLFFFKFRSIFLILLLLVFSTFRFCRNLVAMVATHFLACLWFWVRMLFYCLLCHISVLLSEHFLNKLLNFLQMLELQLNRNVHIKRYNLALHLKDRPRQYQTLRTFSSIHVESDIFKAGNG